MTTLTPPLADWVRCITEERLKFGRQVVENELDSRRSEESWLSSVPFGSGVSLVNQPAAKA